MAQISFSLMISLIFCVSLGLSGCDSKSNLGSSQNIQGSSTQDFQEPSLLFGKSDRTDSAVLKDRLEFMKSYPDVAEKAHVFPVELKAGDRIKVYAWTDQLAMILMYGSDNQDQNWKDEEWRKATNDLKPGLAKQEVEFQAKTDGRHVVVMAPFRGEIEYLLNVQCLSGSCLESDDSQ